MAPSIKKRQPTVVAETGSAVLLLIVLHLAAFAVMAGYRLHTQQYYIAEATIARERAALAEEAAVAEAKDMAERKAEALAKSKAEAKARVDARKDARAKAKRERMKELADRLAAIDNPLEEYEAPVKSLSTRVSEEQESVSAHTEEMGRYDDALNLLERKTELLLQSPIFPDATETEDFSSSVVSQLESWRNLLSIGSLRDIPDEELNDFFMDAVDEIMVLVDDDEENEDDDSEFYHFKNKLAKQFLFEAELGADVVKEPSKFACPDPPKLPPKQIESSEMNTAKLLRQHDREQKRKEAAYEEDLEEYIEEFEDIFGNRIQANGVHALFPESVEDVEEEILLEVGTVMDDIFQLADELEEQVENIEDGSDSDDSEDPSSCIDETFIEELISAGLNAQAAHTDVRESLRKAILRYDSEISEDEIILDADLDAIGGGRTFSKSRDLADFPKIKNINLQSAIDSPLLVKSIDWIDVLVDMIGGYSDELDIYLDSLAGSEGTNSVGEIVVEKILERAGKVGDINVEKYSEAVATILRTITRKR